MVSIDECFDGLLCSSRSNRFLILLWHLSVAFGRDESINSLSSFQSTILRWEENESLLQMFSV